jgi:hypothetical protein
MIPIFALNSLRSCSSWLLQTPSHHHDFLSLLVVLFISRIQSQSAPSTTAYIFEVHPQVLPGALLTLSDDGTVMAISELAFHPPRKTWHSSGYCTKFAATSRCLLPLTQSHSSNQAKLLHEKKFMGHMHTPFQITIIGRNSTSYSGSSL